MMLMEEETMSKEVDLYFESIVETPFRTFHTGEIVEATRQKGNEFLIPCPPLRFSNHPVRVKLPRSSYSIVKEKPLTVGKVAVRLRQVKHKDCLAIACDAYPHSTQDNTGYPIYKVDHHKGITYLRADVEKEETALTIGQVAQKLRTITNKDSEVYVSFEDAELLYDKNLLPLVSLPSTADDGIYYFQVFGLRYIQESF